MKFEFPRKLARKIQSLLCKGTSSVCQRKGHESNYFSQKDRVKRCFQYFSHKCSKSINYSELPRIYRIHCSVLRHLKNMFYMSNEMSWLQPLFTKWSYQIMFSIIRNNIWERIRFQTMHILCIFTAVKSGILIRLFWNCYQMNSWPLSSISFVSSPNGTYLLFVCRDW